MELIIKELYLYLENEFKYKSLNLGLLLSIYDRKNE